MLWIRTGFFADLEQDPAFYLNAEPDLGAQTNADPDPGRHKKFNFYMNGYL